MTTDKLTACSQLIARHFLKSRAALSQDEAEALRVVLGDEFREDDFVIYGMPKLPEKENQDTCGHPLSAIVADKCGTCYCWICVEQAKVKTWTKEKILEREG